MSKRKKFEEDQPFDKKKTEDFNEEEEKYTKIPENDGREDENYEFLIPITNDNKLKTFVDRYFLKHYSIYSKELNLFQYAFLHTNK